MPAGPIGAAGGALLTPRVDVLRSVAGPDEFDAFVRDVVAWCVDPGRVAAVLRALVAFVEGLQGPDRLYAVPPEESQQSTESHLT